MHVNAGSDKLNLSVFGHIIGPQCEQYTTIEIGSCSKQVWDINTSIVNIFELIAPSGVS